ncbi:PQQ-dependent sugar dehydrogenase [Fulvivirga sedimenti]|uniref:PQQ-dependent sugar dehydrogenase n=1 Tax=Fulvivirga sedimenti TaxID=2879465 RepID=A0A9X1L0Q5_9BACT|nr:PQQ-dependent sugar dehydrogenase [Fulvivirga sedimenti]MCA6074934.1 PQQ-dependent sugar dehydrogenase [Fulvivirga sedimenti]MCA6076111.1 PQQ-dependent sugar dehydrogenase [Fulvivirga sedimenti]MCA6077239.1 PQQ-dependent sugar dehydrogenase [Fulvivirga sedimenti]
MKRYYIFLLSVLIVACKPETEEVDAPAPPLPEEALAALNLPDGFEIHTYANVENARSLALSPSGTVYVGNRSGDKVYAVQDTDGDFVGDITYVIDSGLVLPNGVAFRDGDLYVAEVNRILKYSDIESNLASPPDPEVIYDEFPTEKHHGWKYIAFDNDGKLYVPVGAPCNICNPDDEIFASITRMNPDGTGLEVFAHGVRNSVGFDWNPETGDLWFTDNGRDNLGDSIPPCEMNRVTEAGQHFGYPFCHGGYLSDPEFGELGNCDDFVAPQVRFEAHTAPLGMKFYRGNMFPADFKGDIIVAQHGSWNRSKKIGYRLMRVSVENGEATGHSVFIDGWLNDDTQESWGRPVDVLEMPDGSLLVSDDQAGKIYRITYNG